MAGVFSNNEQPLVKSGGVFAGRETPKKEAPKADMGLLIPSHKTKTPTDPVKNIGGVPVGMNIIQPYAEDNPLLKVGKGLVNYGVGTAGRIVQAPQQALMDTTVNLQNIAKGKPLDFSEKSLVRDILPSSVGKGIEGLRKKSPVLGGFVQAAAENALDPTTYIGGGILDDLAKAGTVGRAAKAGTVENMQMLLNRNKAIPTAKPTKPIPQRAPLGPLRRSATPVKQAEEALNLGIEEIQNIVGHNDILAAYPPGTTVSAALADTQKRAGVDLNKLLSDYDQAIARKTTPINQLPKQGTDRIRLGRVAGVTDPPKLSKPMLPKKETPAVDLQKQSLNKATKPKDFSGLKLYTTDVYRNFKDTFGDQYEAVKKRILDPLDASKKEYANLQRQWADKLNAEVVDGLGIHKGRKLSRLVQQYGEKQITLEQLQAAAPNDWNKVVKANEWFRSAYDQMIEEVNAVRAQIYPNVENQLAKLDERIAKVQADAKLSNAERAEQLRHLEAQREDAFRGRRIPKRQDYYRHFREMSDSFAGVKNLFEAPSAINPSLAGVSDYTQPKSKFLSFAQKRLGGAFTNDAVGGFLEYLPAAAYAKHIDPNISNFRALADELTEATKNNPTLNNFIEYLRTYADDLAGKTNFLDRAAQKIIGRKAFRFVDALNSRIKANVILGNIGSAMSQLGNIPQGIAYAKQHSLPGIKRTIRDLVVGQGPIKESGFLSERYLSDVYRQFNTKLLDQPKNAAAWLIESVDKMGSQFIWNSVYEKALAKKIADPVKYADEVTRSLVAGRGVGEVPIAQKAKLTQVFLPFTLEVANLWRVQKDLIREKDLAGLLLLYGASWIFNEVMERTRGTRIIFDPIDAAVDSLTEEDISLLERAGRLGGEVLSNTPGGQFIASLYPEYGTTVAGYKLPTRKGLFGDNDPTRFGPGLLSIKGAQSPLTHIVPPLGGSQVDKTLRGIDALRFGGVYAERPTLVSYGKELITKEPQARTKLKYTVGTDPANAAKGILFGPGAFRETKPYYDDSRRPLSEKQTEQVNAQTGLKREQLYQRKMTERDLAKIKDEIKSIQKDDKLTALQKEEKISKLKAKRQKLLAKQK